MSANITQLRRIIFRRPAAGGTFEVFSLEPDDLGQDTILTFNVAPRHKERASALGTTSTPMAGTFEELSASISMVADTWEVIGKALNVWNAATYTGGSHGGQVLFGSGDPECSTTPVSVIAQGLCDDGSTTDVEFTRCIPSLEDDLELGTTEAAEVTLALNPIAYNPRNHANDGLPAYTVRLGDNDLSTRQRLNVTTGTYETVTE